MNVNYHLSNKIDVSFYIDIVIGLSIWRQLIIDHFALRVSKQDGKLAC